MAHEFKGKKYANTQELAEAIVNDWEGKTASAPLRSDATPQARASDLMGIYQLPEHIRRPLEKIYGRDR